MRDLHAGPRATIAGIVLILSSSLLASLFFVGPPAGGCTQVYVPPEADTGFALRGFDSGHVVYTPDGGNECQLAIPLTGLPVGGFAGGLALTLYGRPTPGRSTRSPEAE